MTTELKDDPIYELRLYQVAPGRMPDMEARVQNDLKTIFPRHGIVPLGGWKAIAGPDAPVYVYLTPFRHMQQRSEAWAGFYADPAWSECRARTNAGSELVPRYDILFLRAITEWQSEPVVAAGEDAPLMEMIMQDVAVGQAMAVRSEILEATVPALRAAGATVHGVFDMMSGPSMPNVVFFVGWTSLEQREQAMAALDLRLVAARKAGKVPLYERANQYLMRPVAVNWGSPTGSAA